MPIIRYIALVTTAITCLNASPRVVNLPIHRENACAETMLQKRSSPINVSLLEYHNSLYYIEVSVGTPAHSVRLKLSMGSSDMWIPGPNACNASTSACWGGSYDISQSSTGQRIDFLGNYSHKYLDGSAVSGFYLSDTVFIGQNVSVTSAGISEATDVTGLDLGVIGLGYETANSGLNESFKYPSILDLMVSQNLISRRAYSLFWDDLETGTGMILFGGYDSERRKDIIATLPLIRYDDDFDANIVLNFSVILTSAYLVAGIDIYEHNSSYPWQMMIDAFEFLTWLPDDLFQMMAAPFQVSAVADENGSYTFSTPCRMRDSNYSVVFMINDAISIQVQASELVISLDQSYDDNDGANDSSTCLFGLANTTSSFILGGTFMRSAYLAMDLDSNLCYIAQAHFNSTTTNIQEITEEGFGLLADGAEGVSVVQVNVSNAISTLTTPMSSLMMTYTAPPTPSSSIPSTSPTPTLITVFATSSISLPNPTSTSGTVRRLAGEQKYMIWAALFTVILTSVLL